MQTLRVLPLPGFVSLTTVFLDCLFAAHFSQPITQFSCSLLFDAKSTFKKKTFTKQHPNYVYLHLLSIATIWKLKICCTFLYFVQSYIFLYTRKTKVQRPKALWDSEVLLENSVCNKGSTIICQRYLDVISWKEAKLIGLIRMSSIEQYTLPGQ